MSISMLQGFLLTVLRVVFQHHGFSYNFAHYECCSEERICTLPQTSEVRFMAQNWPSLPLGHCPCVVDAGSQAHGDPAHRKGNARGPGRGMPGRQAGRQWDRPCLSWPGLRTWSRAHPTCRGTDTSREASVEEATWISVTASRSVGRMDRGLPGREGGRPFRFGVHVVCSLDCHWATKTHWGHSLHVGRSQSGGETNL